MEIHFAQVMARSEDLYKQKLRARKIINRLTREKARLLDTLSALDSEHIKSKEDSIENGKASNDSKQHSIFPEKADIFTDDRIWNDDVKYLAQIQSESYEFSSDDEADPAPRNPMSLIEWLRRNQPSVFTIDTSSNAGADGKNGTEMAPTAASAAAAAAATSGAGTGGTAGSKKRKANGTENGAAGTGSKPSRKRKAPIAAPALAVSQKTEPAESRVMEGAAVSIAPNDDAINENSAPAVKHEKIEQ
ncbi:hypothetical protein D0Z03_002057 [Geotrichum reessii]|nr:hypothetical protein D0Z03_002057 [Galactomyces reessii]